MPDEIQISLWFAPDGLAGEETVQERDDDDDDGNPESRCKSVQSRLGEAISP
jgi:hypothetical protein